MNTMNVRNGIQSEGSRAGKQRSLHLSKNGINLFDRKKKYPGDIHDSSNVPGWNNKV
ncbi:MAG: hypothetical protein HFI15_08930 [Lachnospiraceae bacterium]|jgi:hypothetical protein|nr:hypothetical protein [Lachnospiraceae bacterium]